MENNVNLGSGEAKNSREQEQEQEQVLNLDSANDTGDPEEPQPPRHSSRRTPFTNLSQVDADLALARTLQEQVSLFRSHDTSFVDN